jgi:hypothetical protein
MTPNPNLCRAGSGGTDYTGCNDDPCLNDRPGLFSPTIVDEFAELRSEKECNRLVHKELR